VVDFRPLFGRGQLDRLDRLRQSDPVAGQRRQFAARGGGRLIHAAARSGCGFGGDQFQHGRALERVDPGLAQQADGVIVRGGGQVVALRQTAGEAQLAACQTLLADGVQCAFGRSVGEDLALRVSLGRAGKDLIAEAVVMVGKWQVIIGQRRGSRYRARRRRRSGCG